MGGNAPIGCIAKERTLATIGDGPRVYRILSPVAA